MVARRVPELLEARRRDDGMAFMVLEAIDGETIARKILRDDDFAAARPRLVADFGAALAQIHALDVDAIAGLQRTDQIEYYTERARWSRATASGARTGAQLADRHRDQRRIARASCTATSGSAT